jgi:hypothetical protein
VQMPCLDGLRFCTPLIGYVILELISSFVNQTCTKFHKRGDVVDCADAVSRRLALLYTLDWVFCGKVPQDVLHGNGKYPLLSRG